MSCCHHHVSLLFMGGVLVGCCGLLLPLLVVIIIVMGIGGVGCGATVVPALFLHGFGGHCSHLWVLVDMVGCHFVGVGGHGGMSSHVVVCWWVRLGRLGWGCSPMDNDG